MALSKFFWGEENVYIEQTWLASDAVCPFTICRTRTLIYVVTKLTPAPPQIQSTGSVSGAVRNPFSVHLPSSLQVV